MEFQTFMKEFPIALNSQQQDAVKAVDGPVLLLAVPGSGKTTVLVARLGYMIKCMGISPDKILTLTYTVSAARDMKERFISLFGSELGEQVEFRTINSICVGIIAYFGQVTGRVPFALLSDEKEIMGILSAIYLDVEKEYPAESDLKNLRTWITYIKNMMLAEEEIEKLGKEVKCDLLKMYKAYVGEMNRRKKMDFDDQLVYAYRMLSRYEEILSHFQQMYPYICVDEAQDTSRVQHEIIALLAKRTENIFMVGDEDQSIYGFRAAYPDALLSFEENHRGAKVLLMEENYRSNSNIVKAADGFIKGNTLRHKKTMRAFRDAGSEIERIHLKKREEQYEKLLEVAALAEKKTAVLYRDNESAIPLIDLLERNNMRYRVRNAELSFFTNRVVADIQNIMLLSMDDGSPELFEQVYYKMKTYLKKEIAMRLCAKAGEEGKTVFDVYGEEEYIEERIKKNLGEIRKNLKIMKEEKPANAISRIVNTMGYGDYLERAGVGDGKIYIMKAVAARENSIEGFLERMDELKNLIAGKETDDGANFILSTIHGSKGLEYENVYLMDICDGIFPDSIPSGRRIDPEILKRYEEERRIFYVGVTRAKNNLHIFDVRNGSTFIRQLMPKKKKTSNSVIAKETYEAFIGSIDVGTCVNHEKFGHGLVIKIDDKFLTIDFGAEEKVFSLEIVYEKGILEIE